MHRGLSDASDEPLKEAYHGVAVLRGGESVEVLDKPEEAYRSTAVLRGVESMKSSFEALKFFSVQVVFEQEAHSKRGYGHGTPSNSAQSSRLTAGLRPTNTATLRTSHHSPAWWIIHLSVIRSSRRSPRVLRGGAEHPSFQGGVGHPGFRGGDGHPCSRGRAKGLIMSFGGDQPHVRSCC